MMVAWSTPLGQDTKMDIRIITEDSPPVKNRWLKEGQYFLTNLEGHLDMLMADYENATRDGGPFQLRSVWGASDSRYGWAVRADSGIKTPYDIKPGMTLGYYGWSAFESATRLHRALLAWAQIDPEDVKFVPQFSIDGMARLLIDGRVDVIMAYPTSAAQYEIEASPHGLDWLELNAEEDPEGAARYTAVFSTFHGFGPMTRGVPSSIGKWGMTSLTQWGVRADADTELVYNIAKWLDENYDKYKDGHPSLIAMTIDTTMTVAERDFTPLHDGTVKYLKEVGRWTDAHEKRRQDNIDLIQRYIDAYAEAIDMADEQGLKVDPSNEEWMELWANYKTELGLPEIKTFSGLD